MGLAEASWPISPTPGSQMVDSDLSFERTLLSRCEASDEEWSRCWAKGYDAMLGLVTVTSFQISWTDMNGHRMPDAPFIGADSRSLTIIRISFPLQAGLQGQTARCSAADSHTLRAERWWGS